ncbi:MAG: hypothetical protein KF878_29255 [Planctomycetes bacterium]|nr:hypothetical protein [Planctomycetota bacterium]
MKKTWNGLAISAAAIVVVYLLLHALGGREATAVLSGAAPLDARGALGVLYAGAHLALVALAPILALAAALRAGLERLVAADSASSVASRDASSSG